MTQDKQVTRLSKVAKEFNVGISTIIDFLHKKGINIDPNPNTKISTDLYDILVKEYSSDISVKKESEKLNLKNLRDKKESLTIKDVSEDDNDDIITTDEEVLIKDLSRFSYNKELSDDSYEDESAPGVEDIDEIEPDIEKKQQVKDAQKENKEQEKDIKEKSVDVKVVGKINLESISQKTKPPSKEKEQEKKDEAQDAASQTKEKAEIKKETQKKQETIYKSEIEKLSGPTVLGKIDLPKKEEKKKPVASSSDVENLRKKKKRKRIQKDTPVPVVDKEKQEKKAEEKTKYKQKKGVRKPLKKEIREEDVQKQIKETLARLTTKGKSKGSKHRREKRDAISQRFQEEKVKAELEQNTLKVTEFVSVNELANMMNVPATKVISACMELGLFVSINQRLDAETMALVAEEFNYKVKFVSVEVQEAIKIEEDRKEDLKSRPPIVTVMGHVDHGKTLLLDYIRKTNVIAGEAGGITQHIGAYSVKIDDTRRITFLDTPGHEAFTAMRARGAQITDIAIIVIAADDSVMPQTIEAINHAHAAGVPIIFAINKIDKEGANPEKIKEELAKMNFMVEDWGGKYQSQEISAKKGINIDELLEKILLEAELLDLKANPDKKAYGTIIESSLDKGRGYVATVMVKTGTIKVGNVILAGSCTGHVKAMYNERGKKIDKAGPSTPALILGLNGAPQAGDQFNVMDSDKEAREIANKREQLQREQGLRTQKHITLDEIGRRIAIGNFQELNIIIKGDVDGSVEALSDSLIKLSTEEIQVNIIHKAVGQISESDVLLAAASNAIIIGFQVRPSMSARKLAEKEEIDIRMYSIIYDAINELKDAMEGMLSPEIKENIIATLEIREIFKISKVGTIAGCMVKEGKINRNAKVRIIREGIVIYAGELGSLKRFKDDVKEVQNGYECGLNIANFNDIKVGDIIEGYEEVEIKKKL